MRIYGRIGVVVAMTVLFACEAYSQQTLTVVTYNVQQGTHFTPSGHSPDTQAALIHQNVPNAPDVVVLQEIWQDNLDVYAAALSRQYAGTAWSRVFSGHCWENNSSLPKSCTYV